MRKSINYQTYAKIRDFFNANSGMKFTATSLRDELSVDYLSMRIVLETLHKEKYIIRRLNKYVRAK